MDRKPTSLADLSSYNIDADVAALCCLARFRGQGDEHIERWIWGAFATLLTFYTIVEFIEPMRSVAEILASFALVAFVRLAFVLARDRKRESEYDRLRRRLEERLGYDIVRNCVGSI